MDSFLDNAQRIFDVARADASGESSDFALVIRPDGGIHVIMESPVSLDGAAAYVGARTAYKVTRSANGVRVEGMSGGQSCILQSRSPAREILRDRPVYQLAAPLLTA